MLALPMTSQATEEPDYKVAQKLEDIEVRVAVIQYSGFWSDANYSQHLKKLLAASHAAGLAWLGQPLYWAMVNWRDDTPF
jgi:hypothetical protein